jgi:transposase-like protein
MLDHPPLTSSARTSASLMFTFTRLFGDGKHVQAEPIQTFRCQACHTTFSARRHTPLYRLKTPSHQIAMVLTALAEGLDSSAAERIFGYRQATISTWLSRAARALSDVARAHFPHPLAPAPAVG